MLVFNNLSPSQKSFCPQIDGKIASPWQQKRRNITLSKFKFLFDESQRKKEACHADFYCIVLLTFDFIFAQGIISDKTRCGDFVTDESTKDDRREYGEFVHSFAAHSFTHVVHSSK